MYIMKEKLHGGTVFTLHFSLHEMTEQNEKSFKMRANDDKCLNEEKNVNYLLLA